MAIYNKTDWRDNVTPVDQANLSKIENQLETLTVGISSQEEDIQDLASKYNLLNDSISNLTNNIISLTSNIDELTELVNAHIESL